MTRASDIENAARDVQLHYGLALADGSILDQCVHRLRGALDQPPDARTEALEALATVAREFSTMYLKFNPRSVQIRLNQALARLDEAKPAEDAPTIYDYERNKPAEGAPMCVHGRTGGAFCPHCHDAPQDFPYIKSEEELLDAHTELGAMVNDATPQDDPVGGVSFTDLPQEQDQEPAVGRIPSGGSGEAAVERVATAIRLSYEREGTCWLDVARAAIDAMNGGHDAE